MPEVSFAIPGDLESRTGGYAYARALLATPPVAGWRLTHLQLPGDFPQPDEADLAATASALRAAPADRLLLVDGLAFGCFPDWLLEEQRGRWVALVHHPLALETGVDPERAAVLRESERRALAVSAAVIVTSHETARELVRSYGVPEGRITVAEPGTRRPEAPAPRDGARPCLLSVGTLSPRKGQDCLVQALARLKDLDWRCRLVGSNTREPAAAARVRALIAEHDLAARVELTGEMDEATLATAYRAADVFVLPSYYEGYGMAFAEALSHGLPIVACPTGAVPQTVPAAAALFVPPGDAGALAGALRQLLTDRVLAEAKAAAAWRAGADLPSWQDTAAKLAAALATVRAP